MLRLPALAIVLLVLLGTATPTAASGAQSGALTAPPAAPEAIEACGVRAAESAKSADIERRISGVGQLGGCVTDMTGISHMFLEWSTSDERTHGRICVDPPVRRSQWHCGWDTRDLEPGSYVLRLVAIDAAGNRGSFDQAYRVDAYEPPRSTPEPAPVAPVEPAQPVEPIVPAEPAAVDPVPSDPVPSIEEPLPAVTPTVSLPLEVVVQDRIDECARLELAPGVAADRALSVAVLECMTPALTALGATELGLNEVPVPPAIAVTMPDQTSLDAAEQLLPDTVGGVELQLALPSS